MVVTPLIRFRQNAIFKAHQIMGDGAMESCQRQVRKGCRNCCEYGAVLFEDERLRVVPRGVEVTGRRVENCLGKYGCKFPGRRKPLMCKLTPIVDVVIAEDRRQLATISDNSGNHHCPAAISFDFRMRVNRAVGLLITAGIWVDGSAFMGRLSSEEAGELR